jgi:hypothetical protein
MQNFRKLKVVKAAAGSCVMGRCRIFAPTRASSSRAVND